MDLKPASNPENKMASKPVTIKVVADHVESKGVNTTSTTASAQAVTSASSVLDSSLEAILKKYYPSRG